MSKYQVTLVDRQTNKSTIILIEAKNYQEAKSIAMRDYGLAYIIK